MNNKGSSGLPLDAPLVSYMAWWTALYLSTFSGAVLVGCLISLLELHLFFSLALAAIAFGAWWYWHQNWGEIVTPNREYGLKIGLLGVIILGWLIGVRG